MNELELRQRWPRRRLRRAITAIDAAVDRLERLNLEGRPMLSEGVERHLERILTLVPTEYRPRVRPREEITTLIADLYRAQESLLAEWTGPEWAELRASEAELPPSA